LIICDLICSKKSRLFENYNKLKGKEFKPLERSGLTKAYKLIEAGMTAFREHTQHSERKVRHDAPRDGLNTTADAWIREHRPPGNIFGLAADDEAEAGPLASGTAPLQFDQRYIAASIVDQLL
jgi:hypothetical protein